jgi:hypothetical protein
MKPLSAAASEPAAHLVTRFVLKAGAIILAALSVSRQQGTADTVFVVLCFLAALWSWSLALLGREPIGGPRLTRWDEAVALLCLCQAGKLLMAISALGP